MSFILDALKKAEAERKLGKVPGLDAQPLASVAARRPAYGTAWRLPTLVLLMAAAGAAWWVLQPRQQHTPVVATSPIATPAIANQPAPADAVPAVTAKETVHPGTAIASQVPQATQMPQMPQVTPAPPATPAPPVAAPPVAPPERTVSASLGSQPPALRDLPDKLQREQPQLTIGGYIYADDPAARSILINGILRREGDTIAPGLVFEKMLPRAAILNNRGLRYQLAF